MLFFEGDGKPPNQAFTRVEHGVIIVRFLNGYSISAVERVLRTLPVSNNSICGISVTPVVFSTEIGGLMSSLLLRLLGLLAAGDDWQNHDGH
jgi:hypothetical protein